MTTYAVIEKSVLDRLRLPSSVTHTGLEIDGTVQCFAWEKAGQERFARLAAERASRIINVGYGLGYAHGIFESDERLRTDLIEVNPSVMERARHQVRDASVITSYHLGTWQDELPGLSGSDATIFFDAFPIEATFDYSVESFRRYIDPFLRCASGLEWRACYFIAFDRGEIDFNPPAGLRVARIASSPLSQQFQTVVLADMSLYEVTRIQRPTIEEDVA